MAGKGMEEGPGGLPAGMWLYSFMFDEKWSLSEMVEEQRLPAPSSLALGIAVGAVLTGARFALDYLVFLPAGRKILGFSKRRDNRIAVPALDRLCSTSKILSSEEVARACALTGMSAENVRGYAKERRVLFQENKKLGKFKEAAWRLVVYLSLVVYALNLTLGKPWLADSELTWEDWPLGHLADGLDSFYHVAMGVYWHFVVFQFWDTRRSDFWQMLVHHGATLFLLTFSWLLSLLRIGTLIMLCHDVSDIFMETAKLFNYSQKRFHWCHLAADGFFFVFAGVFGVARLYVFPKYLILTVWRTTVLTDFTRSFFWVLLCTLLLLHMFWFCLILRMIYMFVVHGVEEDIRSDNEEEDEADASTHGGPGKGKVGVGRNGGPAAHSVDHKSKTS